MNDDFVKVYENAVGDVAILRSATTVEINNKYDVTMKTATEMKQWLADKGFRFTGIDDE
jgi:hypothetical protein